MPEGLVQTFRNRGLTRARKRIPPLPSVLIRWRHPPDTETSAVALFAATPLPP